MKKDIYQKAADILANLAEVLNNDDSQLLNNATYQFLVRVFGLDPQTDIAGFQIQWTDSGMLAEEIIGGGVQRCPNALRAQWLARYRRTRVEADMVVVTAIEETTKLCRAKLGMPASLDGKTHVATYAGGVEVHIVGVKVYTVHQMGGSKVIVPLETSLLEEFLNPKPKKSKQTAVEAVQTDEVKTPKTQPETTPKPEPKPESFELQLPPISKANVGKQMDFALA